MADSKNAPLTDEERAELEELRAEKARREERARARRERAELEQLRAEKERSRAAGDADGSAAPAPSSTSAKKRAKKVEAATAAGAQPARKAPAQAKPKPKSQPAADEPQKKSFGVRMVTSDPVAEDEIPGMPPAQKLIIVLAIIAVIVFAAYIALSNAGLI